MRRALSMGVLLLLPVLAACSSGSPTAGSSSSPSTSPTSARSSAPPPPAAPVVGTCHLLNLGQATAPVDTGRTVSCRDTHTSVTVKVGRLSSLEDGHLLAVDSSTVQARVQQACPSNDLSYAGGDQKTQRLSRLEVVWFTPTVEQADAGASWFRCDLVGLASAGKLVLLPPQMKGALGTANALDRFGTCGTAAPGTQGFTRVVCSRRHSWRAVDTITLPAKARYLDSSAGSQGDSACKAIAAAKAHGALRYTWSFEWPTRAQWAAGQRYGYCWLPGA